MVKELILNNWQKEALNFWYKNNYKGIVQASTGSGKTLLGIEISKKFPDENVLVIVQTEHLMLQWKDFFNEYLDEEIGMIGGKYKEEKRITIVIINNLRNVIGKEYDIIIYDECHHSVSNVAINLLVNNKFKRLLLLTATLEREDLRHLLLEELKLQVVYNYTQEEAIKDKLLSQFILINKSVCLQLDEYEKYKELDEFIRENMKLFSSFDEIIKQIKYNPIARMLMKAITGRRSLLLNAESKITETYKILEKEGFPKTIIFCEYIKMAEKIYNLILLKERKDCGIYHSGLKTEERQKMIENFKGDISRILVVVKATDEGINVPNASMGIIVAGSSVKRQSIQT